MIPPLIVEEAVERGIRLIAITDHNGTANIAAVQKASYGSGLAVLPGMELQTREEVHVLCIFDRLEQAQALQDWVNRFLPDTRNNVDFFGEQFVVDETGEFIRREERLLSTSANVSINQAWEKVRELGGLYIPAHVNRIANGLFAMLGFVPDDIDFDALEISRHLKPDEAVKKFPQIIRYPLIQNGDVHYLDGFLGSTEWTLERPCIAEIRLALHGIDGRSVAFRSPE